MEDSPQFEMVNKIKIELENNLNLFDKISFDGLKVKGGIACEISAGYNKDTYLNKSENIVVPLLFLCKSKDQALAYNTLCNIGNYMQRLKKYPECESCYISNIDVATEANKIGKDDHDYYIYSCIINVLIYF